MSTSESREPIPPCPKCGHGPRWVSNRPGEHSPKPGTIEWVACTSQDCELYEQPMTWEQWQEAQQGEG